MTDAPRIPTQFISPDDPGLERVIDTDVPFPPELAALAPEHDAGAVAATHTAPAPNPEAPAGPAPIAAGTYAVYDDQAHGYVLVIGTREGETHHKHIPGHLVKMAEKMMGNSPFSALFGS